MMADLKVLYEELNLHHVLTYIQSGNVIFKDAYTDPEQLAKQIEQKIYSTYQFQVPVINRTLDQVQSIISNNPFIGKQAIDTEKLYVTFFAKSPKEDYVRTMSEVSFKPDEFSIAGKEAYLDCAGSYGNTKLSNSFFERKLKVAATTRNWRTVNELFKLMQAYL